MRSMKLSLGDYPIYYSLFDEKTGTLARAAQLLFSLEGLVKERAISEAEAEEFAKKYDHRIHKYSDSYGFSPSPEMVDIAITNKCGFGCSYCYQNSLPQEPHAPKELVEKVILGFDQPPYQMAIGGGEPTLHPDFPWILRRVRELGTVPNYTTNGERLSREVIAATNEVCGGLAMTYHAFKGLEWFKAHYAPIREAVSRQVNVHVIADNNVCAALEQLSGAGLGKLSVVLLAYYPDDGRAPAQKLQNLLTKQTYSNGLPSAMTSFLADGHQLAFSEGMLPYFLSRPGVGGMDTRYALRSEGHFSCYVDQAGGMYSSSFGVTSWAREYARENGEDVWGKRPQHLWNNLRAPRVPHFRACEACPERERCHAPTPLHYLHCARSEVNAGWGAIHKEEDV